MQRSIEVWVPQVVGQITPAIKLWAECYPLPIGVVAAKRLYAERGQSYPDELTEVLPFQGAQEAYWGLRVVEKRSVADMFGLKGPKGWAPPGEQYLWLGSFAYSLRCCDDTSLIRLVNDGTTWWRDFSLERVRGRPRGSGRWKSPEQFLAALSTAGQELESEGKHRTQDNLGDYFDTDAAGIRRWLRQLDLSWNDAQKVL